MDHFDSYGIRKEFVSYTEVKIVSFTHSPRGFRLVADPSAFTCFHMYYTHRFPSNALIAWKRMRFTMRMGVSANSSSRDIRGDALPFFLSAKCETLSLKEYTYVCLCGVFITV